MQFKIGDRIDFENIDGKRLQGHVHAVNDDVLYPYDIKHRNDVLRIKNDLIYHIAKYKINDKVKALINGVEKECVIFLVYNHKVCLKLKSRKYQVRLESNKTFTYHNVLETEIIM